MYANIRLYPTIGVERNIIERSVTEELLRELQQDEGFERYCAFWADDGAGVSVSIFRDSEDAQRSTDTARRWVMRHQDFFPERGQEFSGECFAHEVASRPDHATAAAPASLHALVRIMSNVPGTQDTRAFVEQRTLPMITRSPGFRTVYMLRGDMDAGRAAVITLFDDRNTAQACHEKAVELLKEGLPVVRIDQVMRGDTVVLTSG